MVRTSGGHLFTKQCCASIYTSSTGERPLPTAMPARQFLPRRPAGAGERLYFELTPQDMAAGVAGHRLRAQRTLRSATLSDPIADTPMVVTLTSCGPTTTTRA